MNKFLITAVLLLFATSAFAKPCCEKNKPKDNIISFGLDAPQDNIGVSGFYWGYERLNLFGPKNRIGIGGRFVSYNRDGSAMFGSVTFRLSDSIFGILEGGNRHLDNEDLDIVNGGAIVMLTPKVGFRITGGTKSFTMGASVGF